VDNFAFALLSSVLRWWITSPLSCFAGGQKEVEKYIKGTLVRSEKRREVNLFRLIPLSSLLSVTLRWCLLGGGISAIFITLSCQYRF
jgi:hypothetical protein